MYQVITRIIRWLLIIGMIILLISGLGITEFRTVEPGQT